MVMKEEGRVRRLPMMGPGPTRAQLHEMIRAAVHSAYFVFEDLDFRNHKPEFFDACKPGSEVQLDGKTFTVLGIDNMTGKVRLYRQKTPAELKESKSC
jgi:hypothetical protein